MPKDNEANDLTVKVPLKDEELVFIRDEGLDLLSLFRKVSDKSKRDLIIEVVRAIADAN